ncbi:MAG: hypothetical protein HFH68_04610 [Lachnospiraceae bacterium]|nr:hypothetical protein [Lachnospiraceae bacterium]
MKRYYFMLSAAAEIQAYAKLTIHINKNAEAARYTGFLAINKSTACL